MSPYEHYLQSGAQMQISYTSGPASIHSFSPSLTLFILFRLLDLCASYSFSGYAAGWWW